MLLRALHAIGRVDPADPAIAALCDAAGKAGVALDRVWGEADPGRRARLEGLVLRAFELDGGYRRWPDVWVRCVLGEQLWSRQVEILRAVARDPVVAVHSCHSSGKSWTMARLVAWWIATHPLTDTMVVTTAPTHAQIKAILWREIRLAHRKAQLPGRVNLTEWVTEVGDLVGIGRKPSDYDEAAFQGIHALYLLVVVDEAGGIPQTMWEDIRKLVTNADARLVAVGNPNHEGSAFHRLCLDPDTASIRISYRDTPNFTGEAVDEKVARVLVGPQWVSWARRTYGEQSAKFQAQAEGLFPKERLDGVIHLRWVQACVYAPGAADRPTEAGTAAAETPAVRRLPALPGVEQAAGGDTLPHLVEAQQGPLGAAVTVELGLDVGEGTDWTVIRERRGVRVGRSWRAQTDDPAQIVDLARTAISEARPSAVKYDSIGPGWAVGELLRREFPGVKFVPVNVAEDAYRLDSHGDRVALVDEHTGRKRFANLRAFLWWSAREAIRERRWDLTALEYDPVTGVRLGDGDDLTVEDLTEVRYSSRATDGAVLIEPKDQVRKRLGRSPDDAEAFLLAFYTPPEAPPPAPEAGGLTVFGLGGPPARSVTLLESAQRRDRQR